MPDLLQSSCATRLPFAPLGVAKVTAAAPEFAGVKSISHGVGRTPPSASHEPSVVRASSSTVAEGLGASPLRGGAGLRCAIVGALGADAAGIAGVCCMLHAVSAIAAIGAKRRGVATLSFSIK